MPRSDRAWAAALALALACSGCGSTPSRQDTGPPPQSESTASEDRDTTAAVLMGATFQTMQHLAQAPPAEQAEILASARSAFERSPRGSAQLRYALLLATPGHAARDPAMAQTLLRELAAQPETLVPIERAVALIELAQLDRELDLKVDNDRLLADTQRTGRERIAATQRRLQTEVDENAKLRKELEELQAKLNAIASIERNLTEKKTAPEVPSQ
jgi:regulator of replication initiation timing